MVKLVSSRIHLTKERSSLDIPFDDNNIVLGHIYKYKLLSASSIMNKLSSILDTGAHISDPYMTIFTSLFKNTLLSVNDAIFYFSLKLIICISNCCDKNNQKTRTVVSQTLLEFISDYIDSINIFCVTPTTDNNSLITNIINLIIFFIDNVISFINLISSIIDTLYCSDDQKNKFLGCYIKYFFQYIQPYIDIIFPCGPKSPPDYVEPKTKVKVEKEHMLVGIARILLKAFEIEIPETSQKTVNIPTHLQRIEIGAFANFYNLVQLIDFDSILKVIVLWLNNLDHNNDDISMIYTLLANSPLANVVLTTMSKISNNDGFDIDNSLNEIKELCTDVPIAIIFKNLIELSINILKPSTLRNIKNLNCIIISFVITVIPVLILEFACCTNCFYFVYLNLRFIIDNIFLLKCLNDIILYHCQNDGSSKYSMGKRNLLYQSTYNYIIFLCKELPKLPVQIIISWLSLKPKMPRYFIDQSINHISTIYNIFNIQDEKYYIFNECDEHKITINPCLDEDYNNDCSDLNYYTYIILGNLLKELKCMISKQYKCKNKDRCDYCGISDACDSLKSCGSCNPNCC